MATTPRKLLLRSGYGGGAPGGEGAHPPRPPPSPPCTLQGLQRRATPHPSELKVMKRGVEERRGEALACRPESGPPSPLEEVPMGTRLAQKGPWPRVSCPSRV